MRRTVGSLVVRASDSRPEGLSSMPPNTLRVSEYTLSTCSLNRWIRKSCGQSEQKPRVQRAGEYFPPLQFYA
ncbi:hypothetical protein TNCV_5045611 [Trichonephila clavipes]|uniref:Uncharacterized protein n=1 Tax=Trichonephila clavipes TaxID=2585209 RepID=A0A8X6WIK3_TRICX|nr:hypothetical protein TNCV_5045611 [Trichonephila clavipes]